MADVRGAAAATSSRARGVVGCVLGHWHAVAALSWLVSGALYLTLPPSPDQFNHLYMGWRLLEGDAPYRDFIDAGWPGVIWLNALAVWAFGVNLWSWRAFDFLIFAACALVVSDLVRQAAGPRAARINLVLCPLIYAGANFYIAGQHDMSAAQFLVGALWCHVRAYARRVSRWQAGTGILLAAAMSIKPTVGVIAVLLPLHALWLGIGVRTVLAQSFVAVTATVAGLLLSLALLLAQGPSLRDVVEATFTFNALTRFENHVSIWELTRRTITLSRHPWWFPAIFASAPAMFWIFRRPNRSLAGTALAVLWLAGLLSYFLQGKGNGYQLAPCLIALAGGHAISLDLVTSVRKSSGSSALQRILASGFVAVTLAVVGAKVAASYYSLPLALLQSNYGQHLSRFPTGNGDVTVADAVGFVSRLNMIPASDCILVVGGDSAINFLSQRPQPTRFYYFAVIEKARSPLPMAQRWVDHWDDDLSRANCQYALISKDIIDNWLYGPSLFARSLRTFLERYRKTGAMGAVGGEWIFERF